MTGLNLNSSASWRDFRYAADFLADNVPGIVYVIWNRDHFGPNNYMWGGYGLRAPDPVNDNQREQRQ